MTKKGIDEKSNLSVVNHLVFSGLWTISSCATHNSTGELWVGQGLCFGLDISLHEIVVLGLITCEEVGVVKGVHLLSGEVRSVTTAFKVVEEVQEEVKEIGDE